MLIAHTSLKHALFPPLSGAFCSRKYVTNGLWINKKPNWIILSRKVIVKSLKAPAFLFRFQKFLDEWVPSSCGLWCLLCHRLSVVTFRPWDVLVCNLLTQAETLIFYSCEKMIRVLEAVLIIYLDTQQGKTRRRLMEYKVTGLIPILTFNYRSGTCVNVSSPSTLIRLEIPNGTCSLCWALETVREREGDTNLTHTFTCLSLGCASSDLNAPLVVRLEGNGRR